jgi:hypothetical protein
MPAKKPAALTQDDLERVVRQHGHRYLSIETVTSVGVGYKIRTVDGVEVPTDELSVQFTVDRKLSPERLRAEGIPLLPESLRTEDGREVPVDVVERVYEVEYRLVEVAAEPEAAPRGIVQGDDADARAARRSRLDTIVPGASVSSPLGSAGTVGAIVYDRTTGEPLLLSNHHVLHDDGGRIGDPCLQPGPFDGGHPERDVFGALTRSHLGLAGDGAVASLRGRDFDAEVFGLGVVPTRVAKADLGDRVVKSGRTTGVTQGIVTRVGVVAKIDYGGRRGVHQVGGFEISPDPAAPPPNHEVSMGGDSGSLWLVVGEDGRPTDVAVGLHFAGETDPDPAAEHALACNLHAILDKLDVALDVPERFHLDDDEMMSAIVQSLEALALRQTAMEAALSQGAATEVRTAAGEKISIPVYGNWCGPGHGSGTPVDAVDDACRRHDQCYAKNGYFNCNCDAKLLADLGPAAAKSGAAGRLAATAIGAYFSVAPCAYHPFGKNFPIPGGTGGTAGLINAGTGAVKSAYKSVKKGAKKVWKKVKGLF